MSANNIILNFPSPVFQSFWVKVLTFETAVEENFDVSATHKPNSTNVNKFPIITFKDDNLVLRKGVRENKNF